MVDERVFRQVMSRFAAGVTVITTRDRDGERIGFTATAFTSVSLAPPLVLCCVVSGCRADRALREAPGFAVSVLREDQADLALRFADRGIEDRFESVGLTDAGLGLPVLTGAIATLTCTGAGFFEAGDHAIHLGQVIDAEHSEDLPLLHFGGAFGELKREQYPLAAEPIADWMVGAAW
jgi:flavin reductase (DIM6/NTAB) family NADH-FMN oxidoreductase RutF